jgi:uncharacterized protein with PIN domain
MESMPMAQIAIRFYAELNDFLPLRRRQVTFIHAFSGRAAIKDVIEALGVPHTEVDLILANGDPVDFSYPVQDGDRISVYPVFEAFDITPLLRLRPQPLREVRFVLDTHLGKLATYLRMLGFDTRYQNDYDDETLVRIATGEHRILLTRDRGLLKRGAVTHGYYVRETAHERQLAEVLRRFDLLRAIAPLQRCLRCNELLAPVSKDAIVGRLPPRVRLGYDDFRICPACSRIYWEGTHYQRMMGFIGRLMQSDEAPR